jgi:hypothetical protein
MTPVRKPEGASVLPARVLSGELPGRWLVIPG